LNSAFNYAWHLPHRFGPTQKVSKTDAKILDYIAAVRDERSEFYIRDLLKPVAEMLGVSQAEALDRLLSLQDRGAITPVGIQTILQRQGMALANGEFIEDIIVTEIASTDRVVVVEEPEPEKDKVEEASVKETKTIEEEPTPVEPEKPAEPAEVAPVEEPEEEETPEPPKKTLKPKKMVFDEPEPHAEESGKEDSKDAFVSEVESILSTKKEEEPAKDEKEKFLEDVESLLSKKKKEEDE
jgi:DNA-binding Lrp family transcriptional regulator